MPFPYALRSTESRSISSSERPGFLFTASISYAQSWSVTCSVQGRDKGIHTVLVIPSLKRINSILLGEAAQSGNKAVTRAVAVSSDLVMS